MRRRHHLAVAVGLLVGQACSHGHPAAVPAKRPAPETLPALDTATYPDVVPETTTTTAPTPTTAPEVVTTTVTTTVPVTTTTPHAAARTTTTTEPAPMGERTVRGAWAIPTYIVLCESAGDWNAANASGAAGAYQLMPEHFNGQDARNFSHAERAAVAARLWDGGAGASNWAQCL